MDHVALLDGNTFIIHNIPYIQHIASPFLGEGCLATYYHSHWLMASCV